MSVETLRLLERVHGHLGWLAAAALIHPAIILRRNNRRAVLSVTLATLFVTLTGVLGAWIYPSYSKLVRRAVYLSSMRHGLLFERKEHLAFAAIALAWAGCLLHLSSRDSAPRQRAAHVAFVCSAALTVVVATLGTIVGAFRSF
jgi:hypothetical protein